MINQQAIEENTLLLYNSVFGNESCINPPCKYGKCICLDNEQTGLLQQLILKDNQIVMQVGKKGIYFENLHSKPAEKYTCKQALKYEELYPKEFYCCIDVFEENLIKEIEKEYNIWGDPLDDVIKAIPVIYMTNSIEEIWKRDTLLNLCVYSSCPEQFLAVLFRAVICKTIGCCQREEDQKEKEAYALKLAEMFKRLNELWINGDMNKLANILDNYLSVWHEKRKNDIKYIWTCNASSLLEDRQKEIRKGMFGQINEKEKVKFYKLYNVIKKILETGNISTGKFPKLNFVMQSKDRMEYDDLIEILDKVKNDKAKLSEVLSRISRIFWEDVDVPTETLEDMQQLV